MQTSPFHFYGEANGRIISPAYTIFENVHLQWLKMPALEATTAGEGKDVPYKDTRNVAVKLLSPHILPDLPGEIISSAHT